MAPSQNLEETNEKITPPSSFIRPPLTPPSTDEKLFAQAPRVIALFHEIRAGKHSDRRPWTEFLLVPGEFGRVQCLLDRDEELRGFVKDKIRYDYDAENYLLFVRMPTAVHELFIARVEDAILSQLKSIRERSDGTATFAQKVNPARSTEIRFPAESNPSDRRSKHEPDTSFWHDDAQYPGVVIEAIVGLDIEYGKKGSRKATLTVWRTRERDTSTGKELYVEKEVKDEVFRDDAGNATDYSGLQLRLRDFAYEELVQEQLGDQDAEIHISSQQLCQFLDAAERKEQQSGSLGKHIISPSIKKRKRSKTPPEEIGSGDEAQYIQQERKVAKRSEDDDCDYEDQ
ncbi:unnamed protein product [Alternaria alternata]